MSLIENMKEIRRNAANKKYYRDRETRSFNEENGATSLRYTLLSVIHEAEPLLKEWYGEDAISLGYSNQDALLTIEWKHPIVLDLSEKGEVYFIDFKNPFRTNQIKMGSNWDQALIDSEFKRFFLYFISELCNVAPEDKPPVISCVTCKYCMTGKDDTHYPYSFYSCAQHVFAKASDAMIEANTNCSLFEKQQ